jgi:hypothetical protein
MFSRKAVALLVATALPLSAASAVLVPTLALAAPDGAALQADPTSFEGTFQRYLLTPDGRIEGMQLAGGTVVRVPPRAFQPDAANIRPGNVVHVEGAAVKTPTGTLVVRAVVQQAGRVIADARSVGHRPGGQPRAPGEDPHRAHANLAPMNATAKVAALVSNRRGHVDMLLLDDGTTVSGHHLDALGLKVGDHVTVAGRGGTYQLGKAIRARTITLPNGEIRDLVGRRHPRRAGGQGSAPA